MEGHTRSQFAQASAQLLERIDRTLAQCARFEAMCGPLAEWAERWSTETLARWLHVESLPLEEREKALVGLALKGTEQAGAVLDTYRPAARDPDHRLFYQVARIEWEQRYKAQACRQATARRMVA